MFTFRTEKLACALAYSATGNFAASEYIAQETFVVAWRNLSRLDGPEKLAGIVKGLAKPGDYVVLLGAGIAAMLAGVVLGARLGGLAPHESLATAFGMNARGAIEIIASSPASQLTMLSPSSALPPLPR